MRDAALLSSNTPWCVMPLSTVHLHGCRRRASGAMYRQKMLRRPGAYTASLAEATWPYVIASKQMVTAAGESK